MSFGIPNHVFSLCLSAVIFLSFPTSGLGQGAFVRTENAAREEGALVHIDTTFGYSKIEEDGFLRLDTGFAFKIEDFNFAIQAPIHFRLVDNAPTSEGAIRDEDWDEVDDYFRIIRYLEYGDPKKPDPLYVRIGELADVSLGHRSIVDRYYNVVDINHYKMGVRATVEADYGGAEILLDHVMPPSIVGIRPYVRPFTFIDSADILKRLSTGLTFVADFAAPTQLSGDPDDYRVNKSRSLIASQTAVAALYGWDIDWSLVETETLEVVPYFDLNALNGDGVGTHFGLFLNLHFGEDFSILTQGDWRYATSGYQPGYFNSIYEIERWVFIGSGESTDPKLEAVKKEGEGRHGYYGGVDLRLFRYLTLGSTVEDYEGPNNSNLTFRLSTPYIAIVKCAAYYTKRNFDKAEDLGNLEDAMFVALTRFLILGPLFVSAEYSHLFKLDEDANDYYGSANNYHFGIGAEFSF